MTDQLQEQLVNELRFKLQEINEKYKDFFHIQLITLCDTGEMKCSECKESETQQQCMRCVFLVEQFKGMANGQPGV